MYHQFLEAVQIGGATCVALQLGRFMQEERDVRSVIWLPGGDGPAWREAERTGLRTRRIDVANATHSNILRAAFANGQFVRRLAALGGVLHFHSTYLYGALRWGLKLSGQRRRIVHVHLEQDASALEWALREPPELVITCARFLEDQVRKALPARYQESQSIAVAPNCVDTDVYSPGDKLAAKQRVGAPLDAPLLLMLANLSPHKGQSTALKAVAQLKARGTYAECWLAGVDREESGYETTLAAEAAALGVGDRVKFLGYRKDGPELLRAADVFLLPSTREGLPLSVLEAQATRVPVVAAPTAGVPEVIEHGVTGMLVSAQDFEGYASSIEALLTQRNFYERVAANAYRQARNEHHRSAYMNHVAELVEDLTGRSHHRRRLETVGC